MREIAQGRSLCHQFCQRRLKPLPRRLSTGRRHNPSSPPVEGRISLREALAATRWRPHGVASTPAMQCKEGRNKC